MRLWLCVLLCIHVSGLIWADNVTQTIPEMTAYEDGQVTFDCKYETKDSNPYLFWYFQSPGTSPRIILVRHQYSTDKENPEAKYAAKLNKQQRSIYLRVSDLSASDSGMYYCALRPTVSLSVYCTVQEPLALCKVLTHGCTVTIYSYMVVSVVCLYCKCIEIKQTQTMTTTMQKSNGKKIHVLSEGSGDS
ncbi:hypothetical protein FKM82_023857 [Ascaphus truei]